MFSGRHWYEKIADMHVAMKERNAGAMVVNGLDETACRLQKLHENAFSIEMSCCKRISDFIKILILSHMYILLFRVT